MRRLWFGPRAPGPDLVEAAARASVRGGLLPREAGSWRIAVMGPKGGSGKTPTAAALGLILAGLRGEITAVLDGNTHLGTLRRRLVPEDVLAPDPMLVMADLAVAGRLVPEWPVLSRFSDLVERLRVFSNCGVDPRLVEEMTGEQYTALLQLLSRAAQLVVSDMGTSTAGAVAIAALDAADQLVICTEMRRDALELVVEWISALAGEPVSYHPDPEDYSSIADGRYAQLVRRAIVVVAPGGGDPVELQPILDWISDVTQARVVVVPFDAHVASGGLIQLDGLQPATRLAYLQVAAYAVSNFGLPPLAWGQPTATRQPAVRPHRPATAAAVGNLPPRAPAAGQASYEPPAAGGWTAPPLPHSAGPLAPAPRPGLAAAANFVLGRELEQVLGVRHTPGELCGGCGDADCAWPTAPRMEQS